MTASVTLAPYRPEFRDALVGLWRTSFEHGVGAPVPHPEDDHRRFFDEHMRVETSVYLALTDRALAGFICFTPDAVVQLYVDVGHLGQGIGTRLLDLAKQRSAGSLWLYTFATNTNAQRFYERHGFEILERGFEETMQLADLRYGWRRHRLPPLGR